MVNNNSQNEFAKKGYLGPSLLVVLCQFADYHVY